MNKILKRTISILLVAVMLFGGTSAPSFAEDDSEVKNAVFNVEMKSETETEVTFTVTYVSNGIVSFAVAAVPSAGLTSKSIAINSAVEGLSLTDNIATYSKPVELTENTLIAEYTYTKVKPTRIIKSDFNVNVDSCVVGAEDRKDITATVNNLLPEAHSAEFTVSRVSETLTDVKFDITYISGDALKFTVAPTSTLSNGTVALTEGVEGLTETEGVISYNGNTPLAANTKLAEITYPKTAQTGIVKADFSITANCFADPDGEVAITPVINNTIPEEHTHVTTGDYQVTVAATCNKKGTKVKYCTECGAIADTQEIDVDPSKHKYVERFRDPSCEDDGYYYKQCTVCKQKTEEEIIPKTGHSWTDWTTVKQPTTSQVGIKRRHCKLCPEIDEAEISRIVVPVKEIILLPEEDIKMEYKKTTQIYINVLPEDSMYSAEFKWKSSNPGVASVDENGLVTAHSFGTTKITVTTADGTVTAVKKVTVQFSFISFFIFLYDLIFG